MANKKSAKPKENNTAAIRSILSLVLSIGIGIGAWFYAPSLLPRLRVNSIYQQMGLTGMSTTVQQAIVAGVLFLIGFLLVTLILMAVMPGDNRSVSDKSVAAQQSKQFEKQRQARGGKRSNRKKT